MTNAGTQTMRDGTIGAATRREALLGGAAILGGAALLPDRAAAAPAACAIAAPLAAVADALLAHLPEVAVYNGTPAALDGGPLARRMDDWSPAGQEAYRAALGEAEVALERIDCTGDPSGGEHLAVARAIVANGTRTAAIGWGRPNPFWYSGHLPYVLSPVAGPHIDTPNVMMAQQSLATPAAVDAWLAKLDDIPRGLAGVVEKLRADEALGCRPPRVLLEKVLPQLDAFLAGPPADHPLVAALRQRTAALAAPARAAAVARATAAIANRARPAYAKLRRHVADMIPRARAEAGVWAQPDGAAVYAANVRALGDTPQTPEQIHAIGLAEVARISAEMAPLLARLGLTQGSVGARMTALAADPAQRFADSDAGRAALIAYLQALVRGAEARYPTLLPPAMIPTSSLEIRRVPVASQDGAPGGYYDPPSLDGTRPGIYWVNLRDMAAVPKLALPTLSYHEGVPGHHTQGAIAARLGSAPLIVQIASFNAYAEGWALYSERLMAELGAYADDAAADLGRLRDELFRAARLVVDTGLHAMQWSRERAIDTMSGITGQAPSEITAEIERYMAWPGQALGYKLGQLRFLALRSAMRARKGGAFDLRAFHAAVLGGGPMPLELIAGRVARV